MRKTGLKRGKSNLVDSSLSPLLLLWKKWLSHAPEWQWHIPWQWRLVFVFSMACVSGKLFHSFFNNFQSSRTGLVLTWAEVLQTSVGQGWIPEPLEKAWVLPLLHCGFPLGSGLFRIVPLGHPAELYGQRALGLTLEASIEQRIMNTSWIFGLNVTRSNFWSFCRGLPVKGFFCHCISS